MKFSIVIPVYNVEKYIDKCLESIKNQTYDNYEVIIVNDGTKDNSVKVIQKYLKDKRFKLYEKKNGGLSDARNYGVKYVTGDYLLFVDSDDYLNKNLLKKISKVDSYDVLKFNIKLVDEKGKILSYENKKSLNGYITLKEALEFEYSEPAWSYVYNAKFFKKNKFKYSKGKIHEDFGLTPYILGKAEKIYYMPFYGYNYVQRPNSIVNGSEKNVRRCNDMLYHFDHLYELIDKDDNIKHKKLLYSYLANGVILKGTILSKRELKWYVSEINRRHLADYLLADTLKRKIKKIALKVDPYSYIRLVTK